MNELKVTIVQTSIIWEDVKTNISQIEELIMNVGETDVIVLPEMFTTGFSMNNALLAAQSLEEGVRFMRNTAKLMNAAICGSIMCEEAGQFYNRFLWVTPDGEILSYDKRHLFSLANEDKYYKSGSTNALIYYKSWKIRPLICYDLRFPVWSRNSNLDTFDLLIYVANWPEKRIVQWSKLLQARAIENVSYVIGVNILGSDGNGFVYNGQSMLVNYLGEPSVLKNVSSGFQTFKLNKSDLQDYRKAFPVLNDADSFQVL